GDAIAKQLLSEYLEGKARTEYKGLPEEYKSSRKTVRDCLVWLHDRLTGGSLFELRDYDRQWRNQARNGRRVNAVCEELEFLVSKVHDGPSQERAMKNQLLHLYEKTNESTELHRLLMEGETYQKMKAHLKLREYMQRLEGSGDGNRYGNGVTPSHNRFNSGSRGGSNGGRYERRAYTCHICGGYRHVQSVCPSRDATAKDMEYKCLSCDGFGHKIAVCPSRVRPPGGMRANVTANGQQSVQATQDSNAQQQAAPAQSFTPIMQPGNAPVQGNPGVGRGGFRGGYKGGRGYSGGNGQYQAGARMLALRCDVEDSVGDEREECDENQMSGNERDSVEGELPQQTDEITDEKCESVLSGTDEEEVFFFKKSRPVEGTIGGLKVTACLDTGADANLIDKRTVDLMDGVTIKEEFSDKLTDAQGQSIRTIGKVVVDVEMNVGKKCKVGFVVAEKEVPTILLGNSALEAMGLELRLKADDQKEVISPDNAVVLRTAYIAPGEVGTIVVSGGRRGEGKKVLIADRDDIVDGINDDAAFVRVPVWNDSKVDRVYERYDVIGRWSKVAQEKDEENIAKEDGSFQVNQCQDIRGDEETRRKYREENEEEMNTKQWIADQRKDEWVLSMIKMIENKVSPDTKVVIPDSTKRTSLADWVVHRGILYLLGNDHERKLYIPEGRREKFIREIHDSPLSGRLGTRKLVQKLLNEVFWGSMAKDVQKVLKKYIDDYKRRMSWMRAIVAARLENERRKMKDRYDAKHKNNMLIKPEIGDRVYIRVEAKSGDIKKMYQYDGPFRVVGTSNTTVTVVRIVDGIDHDQDQDRRTVQWDRVRLVPRGKENDEESIEERMVGLIVKDEETEEVNVSSFRTTVLPGHPMHPDFECKECGRRRVGDVVPEKIQRRMGSVVTALHFDSLRELGALYDLESEWKTLTRLSAHTNMKDRARRKEVGTSALKKAYQDGMCQHVLAEVEHVSGTGVTMEGEDKSVSDAINEALLIGGEKKHRTECIVLIPEDRPFPTLRGEWDEVVGVNYKDEDEMKKILQEMEVSDSFPKSLWIMLARKSSIGSTEKLRAYLLDLTKNYSLTCYLSAAVLPVTPTDFELELAKTHQQFLTSWRSEGTPPNLVL
ncbi:hypothetical protein PMAYCL1PPCAC_33278, partial [Pristionchus mayeri]